MSFCSHCGTEVTEGINFCSNCGNPLNYGQNPEQSDYNSEDHIIGDMLGHSRFFLRIINKIGLFFVVIGFCMPIACDKNGFQIAGHFMDSSSDGKFGLLMILMFIVAIIGILLLISKNINIIADWITTVVCIISGLIVYISQAEDIKLQSGADMITTGWVIAFIGLILSSMVRSKRCPICGRGIENDTDGCPFCENDLSLNYNVRTTVGVPVAQRYSAIEAQVSRDENKFVRSKWFDACEDLSQDNGDLSQDNFEVNCTPCRNCGKQGRKWDEEHMYWVCENCGIRL